MYLSLAALMLAVVLLLGGLVPRLLTSPSPRRLVLFALIAVTFTFLSVRTIKRNYIYKSRYLIWKDAVTKHPNNLRGHVIFAQILERRGEKERAIVHLKESLRLRKFRPIKDRNTEAIDYYNTAITLGRKEKLDNAIVYYRKAIEADPDFLYAHNNLAITMARKNMFDEALSQIFLALQLDGNNPKVQENMLDITNCINLSTE
jgi:tetratricopeptide (TPR) repeat protein